MDTTLAIVGTAGRDDDKERLSANHYEAMCICARFLLNQFNESDYGIDTLVSGGAAWADHVAVTLFLAKEVPKLKLFLPCKFDMDQSMFDITPSFISSKYKGKTTGEIANGYHMAFSRKCHKSSLAEIKLAIEQGAEITVRNGFFARNDDVAQADVILAMTFGDREWVKDGGTSDTVYKYLERVRKYGFFDKSWHYDLNSGEIFSGARAKKKEEEPSIA